MSKETELVIQIGAGLDPVVCDVLEGGVEITHTLAADDYHTDTSLWLDKHQAKQLHDWLGARLVDLFEGTEART